MHISESYYLYSSNFFRLSASELLYTVTTKYRLFWLIFQHRTSSSSTSTQTGSYHCFISVVRV